jgi:hypothetical protein
VYVEQEAMWTSATLVQDLVLGDVDTPSSLAASLSMVAELLECRIDTMVTNGVHWGTRSALVVSLLHFLELKSEVELLRSEQNVDLTDDQADALWPSVSPTTNSLASLVPSLFAGDPPDNADE